MGRAAKIRIYAMRIRKSDIGIITFLNSGMTPLIENSKKSWFIIEFNQEGEIIFTDIVSERTMAEHYDVLSTSPIVLSLKRTKV